jgi:pimeloyl-ACP methyl ester carboxylesterase
VSKIQCPIFFIHEQDDDLVSTGDDVALSKASDNPTNILWQVNNTPHVSAYQNYPEEYITKVSDFFNSVLNMNDQNGLPGQ